MIGAAFGFGFGFSSEESLSELTACRLGTIFGGGFRSVSPSELLSEESSELCTAAALFGAGFGTALLGTSEESEESESELTGRRVTFGAAFFGGGRAGASESLESLDAARVGRGRATLAGGRGGASESLESELTAFRGGGGGGPLAACFFGAGFRGASESLDSLDDTPFFGGGGMVFAAAFRGAGAELESSLESPNAAAGMRGAFAGGFGRAFFGGASDDDSLLSLSETGFRATLGAGLTTFGVGFFGSLSESLDSESEYFVGILRPWGGGARGGGFRGFSSESLVSESEGGRLADGFGGGSFAGTS
eukprot:Sspe_Gene.3120::Locus_1025_Transcript_1_1_Confidence_1.000_Length_1626::g.3120::m.3120